MNSPILCAAAAFAIATSLGACTSRGFYEGMQKSEEMRQDRSPGSPARTAPEVDYDRYQAEREKLEGDTRQ